MERNEFPQKVQVIPGGIKASISLAIAHATFKNVHVTRNKLWLAIAAMVWRAVTWVRADSVGSALDSPIISSFVFYGRAEKESPKFRVNFFNGFHIEQRSREKQWQQSQVYTPRLSTRFLTCPAEKKPSVSHTVQPCSFIAICSDNRFG